MDTFSRFTRDRFNPQCGDLKATCESSDGVCATQVADAAITGVFFLNDPILNVPDLTTPEMQVSNALAMSPRHDCPVWWNISLNATEVKRVVADGGIAVAALDKGNINADGFPSSLLKARITYENSQFPRSVDIDIGTSTRVSIFAPSIDVTLLVPVRRGYIEHDSVVNPARDNNLTFGPGLITDTIITGSALPHCNPLGYRTATCTRTRNEFPAGGGGFVNAPPYIEQIPSGAKTLTMYQDPRNNDNLSWQWVMMDTGATTILGRLGEITPDPITGGFQDIDVVEGATHIARETALSGTNPYQWSFVWEVEL